ncbi:transposase [Weizmannia coagulans]|uniref:transposase n=1 Tax=Heyndrickxia coagulans TaxID=1398 RepID=UPI000303DFE7
MAIIPQMSLFTWKEIEILGDLDRLRLVLDYMPDEAFMQSLEKKRGKGRNDYPVRAMWNSILAGIVFQHESIEKLRRELSRNGQLREMCGFEGQVPTSYAYTRFLKSLIRDEEMMDKMFETLVEQLLERLPDFGKRLAIDSKAISSFSKHPNKHENGGWPPGSGCKS